MATSVLIVFVFLFIYAILHSIIPEKKSKIVSTAINSFIKSFPSIKIEGTIFSKKKSKEQNCINN